MPALSIVGIRLSLFYLVVGTTLGSGTMLAKSGIGPPVLWQALAPHYGIMMYGWMTQFALSVAFWMLPRLEGGKRGRESLFLATLVLLNIGVIGLSAGALWGQVLVALAVGSFAIHAWPRATRLSPAELHALSSTKHG